MAEHTNSEIVKGQIGKYGTTMRIFQDGSFTIDSTFSNSVRDQLVAFSFDIDSMRRKSVVARGIVAVATMGDSLVLASNNRGVVYVTVTGEHSGTKTYTTRNPSNEVLTSIRTLQTVADELLNSSVSREHSTSNAVEVAHSAEAGGRFGGDLCVALSELPIDVRDSIDERLQQGRKKAAIRILVDHLGVGIDPQGARELIDEWTRRSDQQQQRRAPLTFESKNTAVKDSGRTGELRPLEVTKALGQLAELHSAGILSDADFASAKARVLS